MIEPIFDQAIRGLPAFLLAVGTSEAEEQAGGVSRMYGEPIRVTVQDDKPIRFFWRDRLYTVLGVLEHWVVSRDWWQRDSPDAETPPEREFWRVEATPGDVPPAVYELRRDAGTGDWLLVRVWD